jgi:hypothetical protein
MDLRKVTRDRRSFPPWVLEATPMTSSRSRILDVLRARFRSEAPAPPNLVRALSDGQEAVLAADEAFVVRPPRYGAAAGHHAKSTARIAAAAAPKPLAIQYLGFQNNGGRREYLLQARRGEQVGRYTVWIELASFSKGQALLQDGPDICYQKLLRELGDSEVEGSDGIGVTEADLAAYRAAHTVPGRKRVPPPPPPPSRPAQARVPGGRWR